MLIASGRMTNGDDGLVNGLVIALGTFLAGVHGASHGGVQTGWRIAVIGVAIGLDTLAVAWTEQSLWILVALAAVALGVVFLVGRLRARI